MNGVSQYAGQAAGIVIAGRPPSVLLPSTCVCSMCSAKGIYYIRKVKGNTHPFHLLNSFDVVSSIKLFQFLSNSTTLKIL